MEDIEFIEEQEISFAFENFYLVYNITNDNWYIEFNDEDDDDDVWTFSSIYSIIGLDIKGHSFNEQEVEKFKIIAEQEQEGI